MNFSHYTDRAVTLAAELVNTVDTGPHGGDHLQTTDDFAAFLRRLDIEIDTPIRKKDVQEVRDVRERLRAVFHAQGEADAARQLNSLVAEARVVPHLTDHDGTWHLHFALQESSWADFLKATCGMGLLVLVAEDGVSRLKVCDAYDCEDVLVDTSRNKSRRYCTDTCGNRENVAAYRARARQRGAG